MNAKSPAVDLPVSALSRGNRGMLTLGMFSLAHFFVDLYSSVLASFQPVLVENLRLSLAQAGLLGGLLTFSSSLLQPLYGYWSDRFRSKLFSALAPAVAGCFLCALAIAPTYQWAVVLVLLGGAGVASFHPQGSSWATAHIERDRGRWMALFISAGTLGLALGPSLLSAIIAGFGFETAIWAAVPGVILTLILVAWLPSAAGETRAASSFEWAPLRAVWQPLLILYFTVFMRSVVQVTYTQFLPLYLHRERGFTLPEAAHGLSLYLASGAIGGFAGGWLSDRIGARRVILWSFAGSVPFLAAFFYTSGWVSLACLGMGGLVLLFTIPVNLVVAQELVPSQAGTVSALMMGFAWGMAGMLSIPLTGWVSDRTGLELALRSLLVFPVMGWFLTLRLPREL